MARTILTIALLMAAAPAAAMPLEESGSADATGSETVEAVLALLPSLEGEGSPDVAVEVRPDAVLAAAGSLVDALGCTQAVEWTRHYWGGRYGPSSRHEAGFLTGAPVERVTYHQVEVAAPRTLPQRAVSTANAVADEVAGAADAAAGLLTGTSGLSPPVDDRLAVPRNDGSPGTRWVTQRIVETATVDVGIRLTWSERPIAWTPLADTWLLALPVGMPLVAAGEAKLVEACDARVYGYVPGPRTGYDRYESGRERPAAATQLTSLDVVAWVAEPDDLQALGRGCPAGAPCDRESIDAAIGALGLTWQDREAQQAAYRHAARGPATDAAIEPVRASPWARLASIVPGGAVGLAAVLAAVAGLTGGLAVAGARRKGGT